MTIQQKLAAALQKAVSECYGANVSTFEFQATRRDFAGDITVVVFPLSKLLSANPVQIGAKLGEYLTNNEPLVRATNAVAGFLNIELSDSYFADAFKNIAADADYGKVAVQTDAPAVMVEYSSPNTNKPLHLGH